MNKELSPLGGQPAFAETASPQPIGPVLVIEPPGRHVSIDLGEVWRSRDLLWLLMRRDFSVRYRQSLLGVGWAVLRPVLSVIVFTLVFGQWAGLPSDGSSYAAFSFCGLIPWLYFSGCLSSATNSLVGGSSLVTKVYFPRLVLPLSTVAVGLVDLAIALALFILLCLWYGIVPGWAVMLLPLFQLQSMLAALALGLWLTALNVKYRDVAQLVPFATQIGMYLTPIVYSSSLVPPAWRPLYAVNPMVGVVEGFRWALLGQAPPDWTMMAVSSFVTLTLLASGLVFFAKTERFIADLL